MPEARKLTLRFSRPSNRMGQTTHVYFYCQLPWGSVRGPRVKSMTEALILINYFRNPRRLAETGVIPTWIAELIQIDEENANFLREELGKSNGVPPSGSFVPADFFRALANSPPLEERQSMRPGAA